MAKSKLQSLYNAAEGLKNLDLKSKTVVLDEMIEQEEALIKEDILPILQERIDPVLRQIKRPLVLVVDYDPEVEHRTNSYGLGLKVELFERVKKYDLVK